MLAKSVEKVEAFSMKSRHRIQKDWKAKLKAAMPFGLGQVKPKHFRDSAGITWQKSVSVKVIGLGGELTPSIV
jgi:hypothetical protein